MDSEAPPSPMGLSVAPQRISYRIPPRRVFRLIFPHGMCLCGLRMMRIRTF